MKVNFYELDKVVKEIKFVVIPARYQGKWIYVRHKERTTWELPGGHIEAGETIKEAANRELWEETGASEFEIKPLCYYAVERDGIETYGVLLFAEVSVIGPLPELEIEEISLFEEAPENLTYKAIQPFLINKVIEQIGI